MTNSGTRCIVGSATSWQFCGSFTKLYWLSTYLSAFNGIHLKDKKYLLIQNYRVRVGKTHLMFSNNPSYRGTLILHIRTTTPKFIQDAKFAIGANVDGSRRNADDHTIHNITAEFEKESITQMLAIPFQSLPEPVGFQGTIHVDLNRILQVYLLLFFPVPITCWSIALHVMYSTPT